MTVLGTSENQRARLVWVRYRGETGHGSATRPCRRLTLSRLRVHRRSDWRGVQLKPLKAAIQNGRGTRPPRPYGHLGRQYHQIWGALGAYEPAGEDRKRLSSLLRKVGLLR